VELHSQFNRGAAVRLVKSLGSFFALLAGCVLAQSLRAAEGVMAWAYATFAERRDLDGGVASINFGR
jgi:hypothetical protein